MPGRQKWSDEELREKMLAVLDMMLSWDRGAPTPWTLIGRACASARGWEILDQLVKRGQIKVKVERYNGRPIQRVYRVEVPCRKH